MIGYIMFWIGFVVMMWLGVKIGKEIDFEMLYRKFNRKWLEHQFYSLCEEIEAISQTTEW